MPKVHKSREFDVSADEMWALIGDFHGMHKWAQGLEASVASEDGKSRVFKIGPNTMVETLLEAGERSYSYAITEGPMPVENYRSTLSVKGAGDSKCVVDWVGEFEVPDGTPEENAVAIIEMVYNGGLDGMTRTLSS
jgi:hypothetical protein